MVDTPVHTIFATSSRRHFWAGGNAPRRPSYSTAARGRSWCTWTCPSTLSRTRGLADSSTATTHMMLGERLVTAAHVYTAAAVRGAKGTNGCCTSTSSTWTQLLTLHITSSMTSPSSSLLHALRSALYRDTKGIPANKTGQEFVFKKEQ